MAKVILNDGTEYECTFFGLASVGIQYVDVVGQTMKEAMDKFSDTAATAVMTYVTEDDTGKQQTVVRKGFTTLLGVQLPAADGNTVRVSLRRPYADE